MESNNPEIICKDILEVCEEEYKNQEDNFKGMTVFEMIKILKQRREGYQNLLGGKFGVFVLSLIEKGKLFLSKDALRVSNHQNDDFLELSDFIKFKYGDEYEMGADFRLHCKTAPQLNYETLKAVLYKPYNENDEEIKEYEELLKDSKSYFLDQKTKTSKTIIASFYRCGNTLTRKIMESMTGMVTGSLLPTRLFITFQLLMNGLKGEGYNDDQVSIVKTHFPLSIPFLEQMPGQCQTIIFLGREPELTIASYFSVMTAMSHKGTTLSHPNQNYPEHWQRFLDFVTEYYIYFTQFYIDIAQKNKLPILFLTIDDLIKKEESTLKLMAQFSFGKTNIEGTFLEKRIRDLSKTDPSSTQVYKPNDTKERLNEFYNEEQIKVIREKTKSIADFFGFYQEQNKDTLLPYQSANQTNLEILKEYEQKGEIPNIDLQSYLEEGKDGKLDGAKFFFVFSDDLYLKLNLQSEK